MGMLLVFCPMSIVAVAAPYWTSSVETQGRTVSSQASLWKVSVSTELAGVSLDQDVDACVGQMVEECDKIRAARFFTITAVLLSSVSGLSLIAGFSPKPSADLRKRLEFVGVILAIAAQLCVF